MKYENMDDLDHSIHIADNDWSSFFDESEECDLLQPLLACPDDSDLSDLEDLGQQESQRSPGANTSGAESNPADKSYTGCTTSPEQLNQNDTRGPEDGAATSMKLVEICVSCPGRNAITTGSVHKEAEQDVSANIASSSEETKRLTKNEDVQTVSDLKPTKEPDLLPHSPAGLSVNEPDAPERMESGVGTEKERWFVTVNDNLAQRRGCSTSGGKKRKQKKACEGGRQGILSRQGEGSAEKQGKYPSDGLSHKFGNLLEKSPEREKYCEFEDDFFSFHSCDSESCLSAAESVEEARHPLQENPNLQRLLSLTCDSWTENAEVGRAQDGQMSLHLAAANCECYEITTVEPSITFLSCHRAAEMPDDNSTCGRNACSETSGPQAVIDSSACSQEVCLSPLPAPDLPPTACSVADSTETYAKTAGNTKPVYAISAFWDEMEKLTINDILQVRKGRCSPPKLIQEAVMPVNEYNLPNSRLMDSSDAADSDYFTQPDESKQDQSSWELLTSDSEDYWSCAGASANPSPDLHHKSVSSFLMTEDSCTSSEGRETPVPLEDFLGHFDDQESKKRSQIIHDVEAFDTEDWFLLPYDKNVADLNPNSSLETLIPECFSSHTDFLDAHYQTSHPNITECVLRGAKSQSLTIYNPEEIFVTPDFSSTLCREEASSSCLQTGLDEPIPIFSCSRPTIRELTFPKHHHVFLNTDEISPVRFRSCSFIHTNPYGTEGCWRSLVSMRRICFPDKGRICCRASGIWMFPAETEENPTITVEGKAGPDSSRVFTELEEPQKVLEAVRTTKRDGTFSTVKQSDMCLVCIAFASWVLRSSDPEAADAWKAALLANVSALSAIQYLRRYTTKKNPPREEL